MHNQLSNVIYLSYGYSSEENGRYVYDELLESLKKLIAYVESQNLEESINSLLSPCVEKLKNVLVKINSLIKHCDKNLDELVTYFEKLSAIIKLFSNTLKLTGTIEKLHMISQKLMAKMINDAPKSTESALREYMKGSSQKLTLNTPLFIAKEAFIISKKSLYRVGKELEYAKVMGNSSMIYLVNDKIKCLMEERMQLENIMDVAFKISERYILLMNEAEHTARLIEEEVSKLNDQIDKFADVFIGKSVFKPWNNIEETVTKCTNMHAKQHGKETSIKNS